MDGHVPSPLIRLDGVGCRLGRTTILSGISLTLLPGEIVTVIGPNGAGKTTLAKLVLDVLQPTAGGIDTGQPGLCMGLERGRHAAYARAVAACGAWAGSGATPGSISLYLGVFSGRMPSFSNSARSA